VKLLTTEVFEAVERINAKGAKAVDRDRDRCGSIATAQSIESAAANAGGWSPNGWASAKRTHENYRGRARANVNGDGHYNPLSVEPHYQWCAIYHVATGRPAADRAMNGALEFIDPRPTAPYANLERFAFGQPLQIEPKPGLVVIFPAWLQYCVHPFFGMGHRISITMNISVEEE